MINLISGVCGSWRHVQYFARWLLPRNCAVYCNWMLVAKVGET